MINLQEIKEKAEASKQGNWVFEERPTYGAVITDAYISGNVICYSTNYASPSRNPINNKTLQYIAAVNPQTVLKLLRIIEVHTEVLIDMQRYECTSKELLAEHILTLARQAQEQVSKILTEQNEGDDGST